MHIQFKPEDPEPYYWIGVIDWTPLFPRQRRASQGIQRKESQEAGQGKRRLPAPFRGDYVTKYGSMMMKVPKA